MLLRGRFLVTFVVIGVAQAASVRSLWVAVVVDERNAVPFARYQNGRWDSPELDILVFDSEEERWTSSTPPVGLPEKWFLYSSCEPARSIPSAVVEGASSCTKRWTMGLGIPVPTDTLLLSRAEMDLVPFMAISTDGFAALIAPAFDQAERTALRDWVIGAGFPQEEAARRPFRLVLERAWRCDIARDRAIVLVLATRTYDRFDVPDPARSVGNVWIEQRGRSSRVVQISVEIGYLDGKGSSPTTPLGVVSLDGKRFVVTKSDGYAWRGFDVLALDSALRSVASARCVGGC